MVETLANPQKQRNEVKSGMSPTSTHVHTSVKLSFDIATTEK